MTTDKVKLKESEDLTQIVKYRVAANITEHHIKAKFLFIT